MLFHSQLAKCHGEGGSLICKPDSQDTRNPVVPPAFSTVAAENYEGGGQLGFSLGAPRLHPRTSICTHLPFAAERCLSESLWGQGARGASGLGTAELKDKCKGGTEEEASARVICLHENTTY